MFLIDVPPIKSLRAADEAPLLIKMTNGDELVADIFLLPYDDDLGEEVDMVILRRPLQMLATYSQSGKITTMFKKWLLFAELDTVPVRAEDITTIVRVTPEIAIDYRTRAVRIYDDIDPRTEEELAAAAKTAEDDAMAALLNSLDVDETKLN